MINFLKDFSGIKLYLPTIIMKEKIRMSGPPGPNLDLPGLDLVQHFTGTMLDIEWPF